MIKKIIYASVLIGTVLTGFSYSENREWSPEKIASGDNLNDFPSFRKYNFLKDKKYFRELKIPVCYGHSYQNLRSVVIKSALELETFKAETFKTGDVDWKQTFDDAVKSAQIDFSKEALILIRRTMGSGSIKIFLDKVYLRDHTLFCKLKVVLPQGASTMDIKYHCFALTVHPSEIKKIEILENGAVVESLSLGE